MSRRQYDKKPCIKIEGFFQTHRNKTPSYDKDFLLWLRQIAPKYPSLFALSKDLGVSSRTIEKITGKENITLCFLQDDFLYANKEWCEEQYVRLRKPIKQISAETGYSVRVLQKWFQEKFHLQQPQERNILHLTASQKEFILGSILGDGSLSPQAYTLSHSEDQKDYLFWCYRRLENICNHPPRYIAPHDGDINGHSFHAQGSYVFLTKRLDDIDSLRQISFSKILSEITPLQLSLFFLDDGFRGRSGWELCVASYSPEEKNIFINALSQKYGVLAYLRKSDLRYLVLRQFDSEKIDDIILKNIPNDLDIIRHKILKRKD